ncbi:MAG: methyltransferase domain-containing protein [Alphaproteobacteria bacterium]|nr:methyltransferase domain-containing protein [Alphaproteobacteria bacterium]
MRYPTAYDLKSFYNGITGRVIRSLIRARVLELWSPEKHLRYVGVGYAPPYMKPFMDEAERSFCVMSPNLGVHQWPENEKNLVSLGDEHALPLETNSVDRMIVCHHLEFLDHPEEAFEEMYRVLKSTSKIIIIVPNRMGLWSRADWSPLGQGQPYSAKQIETFLKENLFVHERTCQAIFTPAYQNPLWLRMAFIFEKIGRFVYPALGGVHIIEASKQLYATKGRGTPAPITSSAQVKKALNPKPVPTPKVFSRDN